MTESSSIATRVTVWRQRLLHWRVQFRAWSNDVVERLFPARQSAMRLETAFTALCANVETLHARLHDLEERTRLPRPGERSSGVNLTTKGLALKLAAGGHDARQIAGILGLPLGEVQLVLKIGQIQRSMPQPGAQEKSTKAASEIKNSLSLSIQKKKREAQKSCVPAAQREA